VNIPGVWGSRGEYTWRVRSRGDIPGGWGRMGSRGEYTWRVGAGVNIPGGWGSRGEYTWRVREWLVLRCWLMVGWLHFMSSWQRAQVHASTVKSS
jgi:hypothetical protein